MWASTQPLILSMVAWTSTALAEASGKGSAAPQKPQRQNMRVAT